MKPALLTQELGRDFGTVRAVVDLELEVAAGEVFGLLGHNGAGKTTTVRLLNGLLKPTRGRATVLGLDPELEGPALRLRTGVLTETPSLDERLSGRENLTIFAHLFQLPPERVPRRTGELLETFALAERADDRVGTYSKGMKQRLALARTLLHRPELLFLDEPTAALDPLAARQVHELILELSRQEGRTVVLATHNLVEAQRLCQRVGVMQQGRLIAVGTPAELARSWGQHLSLRLEVVPEDREHVLELLRPDHQIGVDGDLLVVPSFPRDEIPDLVRRLVAAGISLQAVIPEEPSLERIYFALHGPEESEAGP